MHRLRFGTNLGRAVIAAPFALLLFTASASASTTLPPRKPGFWVTTTTMKMSMNGQTMGGTPTISAICSDAETDAVEMKRMTSDHSHCSKFDIEGSGNTYTMAGSCTGPSGGAITIHGTVTIENETTMHMVSETTGPQMIANMAADSIWTGECPAGYIPGDIALKKNGQFVKTTNILTPAPAPAPAPAPTPTP